MCRETFGIWNPRRIGREEKIRGVRERDVPVGERSSLDVDDRESGGRGDVVELARIVQFKIE